jgi:hypothetical protein
MNAKIRAERIFKNQPRFVRTQSGGNSPQQVVADLGAQLWTYSNSGYNLPDVRIHFFGVAWGTGDKEKKALYSEIAKVDFTNRKQSTSLLLTLTSGETRLLPVSGNDGKLFDSFTMHRFLRNVAIDYHQFPQEWILPS